MPCPDSFLILANSSINIDTDDSVKQTIERIQICFPVDPHSERKSVETSYSSGGTVSTTTQFIWDL
jgi:hypothetical protein